MDTRLHQLQGKAERLTPVAIALGSNLGDRRGHLVWAAEQLETWVDNLRLAPLIDTDPVDVPEPQPPYLNTVAVGQTGVPPRDLLLALLDLEQQRHRTRSGWRAPRTLDLDLILYGDLVVDTPDLVVPHPRFREREFVLAPLATVAPDMIDPVTGLTAKALLTKLQSRP